MISVWRKANPKKCLGRDPNFQQKSFRENYPISVKILIVTKFIEQLTPRFELHSQKATTAYIRKNAELKSLFFRKNWTSKQTTRLKANAVIESSIPIRIHVSRETTTWGIIVEFSMNADVLGWWLYLNHFSMNADFLRHHFWFHDYLNHFKGSEN